MAKRAVLILVIIIVVVAVIFIVNHSDILLSSPIPSLELSIQDARTRRFNLIIDVRTLKEREELGFYPNSIPIGIGQLMNEVPILTSSKNNSILIYSNGGDRLAENAAKLLYKLGYHNARYISVSYKQLISQ